MTTVHTKEQLEQAMKSGVSDILIEGELAIHVHNGHRLPRLGVAALAALTAAVAAIPFTAGLSVAAVASVAGFTGVEIALVIAAVVLGIGFLRAIWSDWEEVHFDFGPPPKAHIRRRRTP